MDAPKCRLCGERHYGLCPSLKGSAAKARAASADAQAQPTERGSQRQPHHEGKRRQKARSSAVEPTAHNGLVAGSTPAAPTKRKRAPNGTFDRKTYQRELMRKRRTAEKRK